MDVYGIVTEKIISMLENGIVPWRWPWTSAGLPRNLVSKKPAIQSCRHPQLLPERSAINGNRAPALFPL